MITKENDADTVMDPMPAKRYDYVYDTSSDPNHEDSLYHSSANNRLMRVDRHAGISAQDALDHVDDYFYNLAGNVTRIVSHDVAAGMEKLGAGGMGKRPDSSELADSVPYADTDGRRGARAIELARDDGAGGGGAAAMSGGSGDPYTAVRFVYAENGRTVTFAMGDHWYWDSTSDTPPTGYGADWGREFRYDGARQRYLDRELSALELESAYVYATATTNTHYDGDSPYWSVKHETGNPDDVKTGFELGTARINDLGGTASTDYYHTDMLGTTRFLTDASGGQIEPAVYTAFGELVSGTSGRFGYVGAHGYQTAASDTPGDPYAADMPYQHVGARYYDPTTGRFVQRDPIGIRGGINVYGYAANAPSNTTDPSGLESRLQYWHRYNTPAEKKKRQEEWDRQQKWLKRRQENPSTYFYDDMQRDLHIYKMNAKMASWGLTCVGGYSAIVTRSIVAGALTVAGALKNWWSS